MSDFDKHDYYARAAQNPAADVRFYRELAREFTGRAPKVLREDFCGTFRVACAWAALGPGHVAYGRELDAEAIRYGRERVLSALAPEQRARVRIARRDAGAPGGPACDLVLALNFSYFALRDRAELKRYFVNARKSLRPGGLLAVDAFGGPGAQKPNRERVDHGDFVYTWQQYDFDPVSHRARCAMHFKPRGRRAVRDAFVYDWRLWTVAETRDAMTEAGFRRTEVFWQDDNGRYARDPRGGRERVWVALLVAQK